MAFGKKFKRILKAIIEWATSRTQQPIDKIPVTLLTRRARQQYSRSQVTDNNKVPMAL